MISYFSVRWRLRVLLIAMSTCVFTSCSYSEIPGLRLLGPAGPDEKYVHDYSGFVFPNRIGHFVRVSMHNLDPIGGEISVVYNSDSGIMLTVYVYPTWRASVGTEKDPLEDHFQGLKDMALRNSPGAQLTADGPSRVTQNEKSYSGRKAVMTLEDFRAKATRSRKRPKGISELHVFRLGEYFIKYRIAYSEAIRSKAEKEIKDFMGALKWPSE